jgi:hypothetical protein
VSEVSYPEYSWCNIVTVKGSEREKRRGSGGEKGKRCLPSCTDTLSSHSIWSDSLEPTDKQIEKLISATSDHQHPRDPSSEKGDLVNATHIGAFASISGTMKNLTIDPRMYTCSSWETRPSRPVTVISRREMLRVSSASIKLPRYNYKP